MALFAFTLDSLYILCGPFYAYLLEIFIGLNVLIGIFYWLQNNIYNKVVTSFLNM